MPNLRDHFQSVVITKALTGRLNFLVLDTQATQAKSVRAFCVLKCPIKGQKMSRFTLLGHI